MMLINAYCIYDDKAKGYTSPFFVFNDAVAIRDFGSLLMDRNHPYAKFPQDYTLFKIGSFDTEKGAVKPEAILSALGNGLEILGRVQQDLEKLDGQIDWTQGKGLKPEQEIALANKMEQ